MATTNSRSFRASVSTGRRAFQSSITPKSTFSTQAATKSPLRGLAKALGLAGDIADRQQKLQDESDKQRGLMESLVSSADKDPALIKAKEMYPQESLAFMSAFREGHAKLWAQKKHTAWKLEYNTWEHKNENDPTHFQDWLAKKIGDARSVIGDNQFAIAGAMPVFNEAIHNMTAAHTKYTGDRIIAEEEQNILERIDQTVQNRNVDNPTHPSYDPKGSSLFAYINTEIGMASKKGLDATKIKDQILTNLLATADAYDDDNLYELIMTSSDSGLLKLNPEQLLKVENSQLNHRQERDAEDADIAAQAKALKKEEEDTFLGSYLTRFANKDYRMDDIPPELIKKYPKVYTAIQSALTQMRKANDYVNPQDETNAVIEINRVIYSEDFKKLPTPQRVSSLTNLIKNKELQLSEGTVSKLYATVGKDPKDTKIFLNNATVKTSHAPLVKSIKTSLDSKNTDFGQLVTGTAATTFESLMATYTAGIDTAGMDAVAASKKYTEAAEAVLEHMLETESGFYSKVESILARTGEDAVNLPRPLMRAYTKETTDRNAAAKAAAEADKIKAEQIRLQLEEAARLEQIAAEALAKATQEKADQKETEEKAQEDVDSAENPEEVPDVPPYEPTVLENAGTAALDVINDLLGSTKEADAFKAKQQ